MRINSATLALVVSLSSSVVALAREPEWRIYSNPAGTSVAIPAGIFTSPISRLEAGTGDKFSTADGRAMLSIYVLPANGQSPETYLRAHMTNRSGDLDYRRVTKHFFAVSKYARDNVLYRRCNFSNGKIHCIDLAYPRREEKAWDRIVTRISLSLRPLRG